MKISIARALTELKMIDKRIESNTRKLELISVVDNSNRKIKGNYSKEEFCKKCIAEFDSITDLIERRKKIKSSIAYSNAITMIEIAGKEYTVAEIIERKNSIIFEKQLLHKMRVQYQNAVDAVMYKNKEMEENLNRILTSNLSSDNLKKENVLNGFAKTYKEDNKCELLDPLKLEKRIQKLELEIDTFESEVDSILTESNVITKIEI